MGESRQTLATVRADFDGIALLASETWNHNSYYHGYLMSRIPARCRRILEIGCGTGGFSRLLAGRAEKVFALDLSPQMIRVAQENSQDYPNIDFVTADVSAFPLMDNQYDCIATLATLHHLSFESSLRKISQALQPGGVFVCLDLYQRSTLSDWLCDCVAYPVNILFTLIKTGAPRPPKEIRAAYTEHAKNDTYLTLAEIKRMCAEILPGAAVRRHLFWRYSIVWRKQTTAKD